MPGPRLSADNGRPITQANGHARRGPSSETASIQTIAAAGALPSRPPPEVVSTANPAARTARPASPLNSETGLPPDGGFPEGVGGTDRDARRALANAASWVVTIAAASPATNGSQPTTMWSPTGSMPALVKSPCSSRAATTLTGAAAPRRRSRRAAPRRRSSGAPAVACFRSRGRGRARGGAAGRRARRCWRRRRLATNAASRAKTVSPATAVLAAQCVLRRFRLAARGSGQDPQAGLARGRRRDAIGDGLRVGARLEEDADQVGPITRAGKPRRDVVAEEDRRLAREPMPGRRVGDTDDGDVGRRAP